MRRSAVVWLTVVLAACFSASAAEPVTITLVDGAALDAGSVSFSPDGGELQIGERRVPMDDVRWISPTKVAAILADSPSRLVQIWLDGGRITAADVAIDNEQVRIVRSKTETWTLPLDAVRAVWWSPTAPPPMFVAEIAQRDEKHDRLLLMVNAAPTVIRGYLEAVADEQVRMEWMDEVRNVSRAVCLGFVTTQTADQAPPQPRFGVRLLDGSLVPSSALVVNDDDTVRCRVATDVELSVRWADVERIEVASDRLRFLSDLTPVEVRSETIVALPRPWQADRSVTGRTLQTASLREAKGLGMQAGTRLVFDVADLDAGQFAAEWSLDPITGKTGDCEYVIRGDGRELLRQRVRGGEPAAAIRVDIAGVTRLEVGVESGENLDLGDHANWCDARLIRPARPAAEIRD
ncbi:MAG TPA: NPCBM/NEW2 domain-containing protein [Planctomycetaceae bacterium]|nr:NPCBM/NEW2 domain-containing protein [Planctomycetaceae bacterium]